MPLDRRIGWKLYLWVVVGLIVVFYFADGLGWMQTADFADLGATTLSLLGLFGFAHRRAIGRRPFWSAWLPFQVVLDFTMLSILEPAGLMGQFPDAEKTPFLSISTVGTVLPSLPLYVALYRYAYRSSDLWTTREETS